KLAINFSNQSQSSYVPEIIKITSKDIAHKLYEEAKDSSSLYIDIETTSLNVFSEDFGIRLVGLQTKKDHPIYQLDIENPPPDLNEVLSIIRDMVTDPSIRKIAHEVKFDILALARLLNIKSIDDLLSGQIDDTIIKHYLINENIPHSLEYISTDFPRYAGYKQRYTSGYSSPSEMPMDILSQYNAIDVDIVSTIDEQFTEKLHTLALDFPYYKLLRPVVKVY
ncbi:MAG: hypothetical protein QXT63_05540, partial [Thermoplasmata archaeon]